MSPLNKILRVEALAVTSVPSAILNETVTVEVELLTDPYLFITTLSMRTPCFIILTDLSTLFRAIKKIIPDISIKINRASLSFISQSFENLKYDPAIKRDNNVLY